MGSNTISNVAFGTRSPQNSCFYCEDLGSNGTSDGLQSERGELSLAFQNKVQVTSSQKKIHMLDLAGGKSRSPSGQKLSTRGHFQYAA